MRYGKSMSEALAEIREGFSKKEIKMAIGVASDPRYKQGNYSGAVRAIEKIKKGLSTHPQVAAVLKRQNEEILEKVKCPDCEGEGCPKCEGNGYIADAVDKEDEPFLKDLIKNLRKGSATHSKQADDLEKAVKEETELDEGKAYKFAAVDKKGLVIGFASDEKDAKDMARRNKGRVVTLTKPLPDKKGDMMVNRPLPDKMDKFPTNTSATQGKRMEEVELDEDKSSTVYDFDRLIQDGGIDKRDFRKAKNLYVSGKLMDLRKFIYNLDTDPLESIMAIISKNDPKAFMKMYPKSKKGEYMSSIAHAHREETVVESWELNEMKMDDPKLLKIFDKLKKGSTVKIKIDSAISKGKDYREFTVTAKNIVGKGKRFEQEKITLKAKDNPTGVKHFLYNRDGKVTLAIGDMGASIADIKENRMSAYTAAITKGVK